MDRRGMPSQNAAWLMAKRRLRASALFAGAREVIIEHGSEEYRLQITRHGKLILTK